MPELKTDKILYKPCAITRTSNKHPIIDALDDGQVFVATGGNGSAAKSSDEIGRLVAKLAIDGSLDDEFFKESDFRAPACAHK